VTKPLRIGLTGGIASGKSTVADMFAELGAVVIDTDVVAREVVQPGQPALDEIVEAFGPGMLAADGSLDRKAMRRLVFADDEARATLESILHPRIRAETIRQSTAPAGTIQADRHLTDRPTSGYQIIVIPLLVESTLKSFVDRVLVVDCDEGTQLARLLARDAGSEAEARGMIAAQSGREDRLAIADDVISNDKSLEDTRAQVVALHEIYRSLA